MKKFTLFMTLFIAATMNIFAQEESKLELVRTNPSTTEEIEGIGSVDFTFSENVEIVTDIVKYLEIKDSENNVVAKVSLENVYIWNQDVYPNVMPIDTIWHEYTDEKTGETIKYEEYVYADLSIPGIYTMTIPAGVFVSAQDNSITLPETKLQFNVVTPKPSWYSDFDYTSQTREFEKITIGFQNADKVVCNDIEEKPMLMNFDSGATYEGNVTLIEEVDEKDGKTTTRIEISFGEKFTEEGNYHVMIPAGLFTMNDEVSNEEKVFEFEILAPVEVIPLEISNVEEFTGENGQYEKFIITFNQNVILAQDENWQPISSVIYLKDKDGNEYKLTENYNWNLGWNQLEYICGGYDENWNMIFEPITAVGTYILDISQIVVEYGYDAASNIYNAQGYCEGIYTYEIADTAIEGIDADAENAEIYDLTGRKVEKITNAGIYIVNGVKKIVK